MKVLENKENISELAFTANVYPFCPIGTDTYGAKIEVRCELDKQYPEYCELTAEINRLSGKEYTVEQLCEAVANIVNEFKPNSASIAVNASSNIHLSVTVVKKI